MNALFLHLYDQVSLIARKERGENASFGVFFSSTGPDRKDFCEAWWVNKKGKRESISASGLLTLSDKIRERFTVL